MESLNKPQRPVENLAKKQFANRLIVATLCIAVVFMLGLVTYTPPSNRAWFEGALLAAVVLLPSFACIYLLPVLLRGQGEQRVAALVLLILSGYFAYRGWEIAIVDYVINR